MGNDWLAVPRMDVPGWNVYEDEHHLVAHVVWEADARFIASAPGLVSRLTAESEAAKREIERLTRELDAKQQMYASLQGHFDRTVSACKAALEQRDAANAAASELQRHFDRAIALGETLKSQRDADDQRASEARGKALDEVSAPHDCEDGVSLEPKRVRLLGQDRDTALARAEAAEQARDAAVEAHAALLSRLAVDGTLDAMEQRARAEAAEKRVAELESRSVTCPACGESMTASQTVPVRELEARAMAAERRVAELEGALEAAADVIRDHLAESYPVVLDRADAALASGNGEAPAREGGR